VEERTRGGKRKERKEWREGKGSGGITMGFCLPRSKFSGYVAA